MKRQRYARRIPAVAVAVGLLVWTAGYLAAQQPSKGQKLGHAAQQMNMRLVGHNDLQARSAYQPIVHQHPDGRWIAYVGHHEEDFKDNGTSIVDVTDPTHPTYLKHLPAADGAQMVRACNGSSTLGVPGKVYMLRATGSAHEVWDVTDVGIDPTKPSLVATVVANLGATHKNWWECETGIAYLVSAVPGWRVSRVTQVFDLSDPEHPQHIRDFGLVGQQPGATGAFDPQGPHGCISVVAKNRIYCGHGTSSNGILVILDRDKLVNGDTSILDPVARFEPTPTNLNFPLISRLNTSPTMGAHTTFPVLQLPVPEFAKQAQGNVRDFVILVNEASGNTAADVCPGNRQLVYIVDVTIAPIGNLAPNETKSMSIASFQVPEASGNFCDRGGRFGAHASNESFTPVFYGKLVFVSWFNAGVRAIDIREPWSPREAAYYIPATTANTDQRCATRVIDGVPTEICKIAIQTNNVEVDDRGLIYIVDRANTGLHILELTGSAREIANLP